MDFEFAKQLYFRELDGRFQQDSRTSIHVGLLSVIGGIVAVLLQRVWPQIINLVQIMDSQQNAGFTIAPLQPLWTSQNILSVICLGFCILAACACVAALIFLLRAAVGAKYEALASPTELLNHSGNLAKYHAQYSTPDSTFQSDFQNYLIQKMVEATTQNTRTNFMRSARYHRASKCLAFAIIMASLAGIVIALRAVNEIYKTM